MRKDFTKSVSFLVVLVGFMLILKLIDTRTGFFTRLAVAVYKGLLG